MIYQNNLHVRESKGGHTKYDPGFSRCVGFGFFLALLSFSVYFVLQTLTRSVLMDTIPYYMTESYASTLGIYHVVCLLGMIVYFVVQYEFLTFAEIARNRWYVLVKTGFSAKKMVFVKISARLLEGIVIFTTGYICTLLLSFFLKFTTAGGYFFSFYITGIVNVILVIMLSMTFSLFIKEQKNARYGVPVAFAVLGVLGKIMNYTKVLHDKSLMSDAKNLFNPEVTVFIWMELVMIAVCFVLTLAGAKRAAIYSSFEFYEGDLDFPGDVHIVKQGKNGFTKPIEKTYLAKRRRKAADLALSGATVVLIALFLILNGVILAVSFVSTGKEADIFGYIPYVFQSETMEPAIDYNDFVMFTSGFTEEEIKEGDIVLFTYNKEAAVEEVREVRDSELVVDIRNYPKEAEDNSLEKVIDKTAVYGIYAGKNRWLGVLILFMNTMIGRIVLLFIPCILIFYYRQIIEFIRRKKEW